MYTCQSQSPNLSHQQSLTKENSTTYTSSRRTGITDGRSELQEVLKKEIVNVWANVMSTDCIKLVMTSGGLKKQDRNKIFDGSIAGRRMNGVKMFEVLCIPQGKGKIIHCH